MTVLDSDTDRDSPPAPRVERADPFSCWRSLHEGFAPLYNSAVMRDALSELGPALGPGSRAVDLGCGTGHAAEALAAAGGLAVGLDLDAGILRRGRSAHPARVAVTGHLEQLPFADRSLDAAFSFSALQYPDRGRALRELHRVLKPGGRFALVENLHDNPVALAYRFGNAMARRPYRGTVRPRRHLRWSERHEYLAVFPDTRFRAYQLFAPLLLAAAPVARAPADVPERAWIRNIIETVERLEQFLLRHVPLTRAAWLVLATGRRP